MPPTRTSSLVVLEQDARWDERIARHLVDRESVAFLQQLPDENVIDFLRRIVRRAGALERARTPVGTIVLVCGGSAAPHATAVRARLARHLAMVLAGNPAARLVLVAGEASEANMVDLLETAGKVLEVLEGADLTVRAVVCGAAARAVSARTQGAAEPFSSRHAICLSGSYGNEVRRSVRLHESWGKRQNGPHRRGRHGAQTPRGAGAQGGRAESR